MVRAALFAAVLMSGPSIAGAQQLCTTDTRHVVNEIYRHMLERGADAGSSHYVQQLESGRPVREVVRDIAKSDEHTQRFWRQESGEAVPFYRSVGTFYRHILGRQPDDQGARTWAQLGARNGSGAVIDRLIDSPEYDQQFGDWGVPGSGGVRYCGPDNQGAASFSTSTAINDRFNGMDRNRDGVISRNEWRGNQQSFEVQDWNGDDLLSEDELDGGAGRFGREAGNRNARRAQRFDNLDVNRNGRLEPREWDGNVAQFNRLDVNNDNVLTRAEMINAGMGNEVDAVGTSGDMIRVAGTSRWTDTFIDVRVGDMITFEAEGTVRLSDGDDVAGASGVNRRSRTTPFPNQPVGALIGRIGNEEFFVGSRRTVRAPVSGRLYLGVNDDYIADNSGDFQVVVTLNTR